MSQCSDLLALLADGRPHEMHDIHRRIGFCRLNSRVAELRARGHRISCDKSGGRYVYTLGEPLEAAGAVVAPTPAASSGPSAAGPLTTSGAVGHVAGSSAAVSLVGELERAPEILDGQLSVFDALAAVA